MDPNWFYSSLAQSAAAIVGIIGGFLVQGLLRQRQEASLFWERLVQVAQRMMNDQGRVVAPRLSFLEWFRREVAADLGMNRSAIQVKHGAIRNRNWGPRSLLDSR